MRSGREATRMDVQDETAKSTKFPWLWKMHWVSSECILVKWTGWIASGIVGPWQAKLPDGRRQLTPDCRVLLTQHCCCCCNRFRFTFFADACCWLLPPAWLLAVKISLGSRQLVTARTDLGRTKASGDPREDGPGTFHRTELLWIPGPSLAADFVPGQ